MVFYKIIYFIILNILFVGFKTARDVYKVLDSSECSVDGGVYYVIFKNSVLLTC